MQTNVEADLFHKRDQLPCRVGKGNVKRKEERKVTWAGKRHLDGKEIEGVKKQDFLLFCFLSFRESCQPFPFFILSSFLPNIFPPLSQPMPTGKAAAFDNSFPPENKRTKILFRATSGCRRTCGWSTSTNKVNHSRIRRKSIDFFPIA